MVVSSVVGLGISCESVQRTSREIIVMAIEPNLHQLLHQTGLHLGELPLVQVEEKTTYMFSTIARSMRVHQKLSLV